MAVFDENLTKPAFGFFNWIDPLNGVDLRAHKTKKHQSCATRTILNFRIAHSFEDFFKEGLKIGLNN